MRAVNTSYRFALLPLIMLSACGDLPGFIVNEKTDEFKQSAVRNDKIDILFVVDNSGSMGDEQTNLANSFDGFIKKFAEKNLNFQVGVISTDNTVSASWWGSTGPYKDFPNVGPGSLLAYKTNEKIIRPTTPNYINQFKQNVKIGTGGSGAEAGAMAATTALSPSLLAAFNAGFIRSEALLSVVIVSDEDESRPTVSGGSEQSKYIRGFPSEASVRRQAFIDRMTEVKPTAALFRYDSIISTNITDCPSIVTNGDGLLATGDFYKDLSNHYNGGIISICQDFSDPLVQIGANLVQFLSRFKLKQKAEGQINVFVDGQLVTRNAVNGWEYISETNEVEFRGEAIPSANAKIEVAYVPGEPLR